MFQDTGPLSQKRRDDPNEVLPGASEASVSRRFRCCWLWGWLAWSTSVAGVWQDAYILPLRAD